MYLLFEKLNFRQKQVGYVGMRCEHQGCMQSTQRYYAPIER